MPLDRRRTLRLALLGPAALLLGVAAGCGQPTAQDEDCDAEDLRHREPECGYTDSSGRWRTYPWVGVNGGHPPAGVHPKPPAGAKPGTGSKTRTGSRTGSGVKPGIRPGGGRRR